MKRYGTTEKTTKVEQDEEIIEIPKAREPEASEEDNIKEPPPEKRPY